MEGFLKSVGLYQIQDLEYRKEIGQGKASSVFLYENDHEKKIIKMLIVPRREEEIDLLENEVENHANAEDLAEEFVPQLESEEVIRHNNYPIYYYIMEYIEGKSLKEIMTDVPLPWEYKRALKLVKTLSFALSRIAGKNIVHRDLHPGNIILKDSKEITRDSIVILDFGLSKDTFEEYFQESPNFNENYLRHFGAVSSWSPEFLKDPGNINYKHDIWAIGVIFFRLLAGRSNYPVQAAKFEDLYKNLVINFDLNFDLIKEKHDLHKEEMMFLKKILSQNPQIRPSFNEIYQMSKDILSGRLNNKSLEFLDIYFGLNGMVAFCPRCENLTAIFDSRCNTCGNRTEPGEWIPPLNDPLCERHGYIP